MNYTFTHSYSDVWPDSSGAPDGEKLRVFLGDTHTALTQGYVTVASKTVAELTAIAGGSPAPDAGDTYYCSNGNAGSACWATWNGTAFKVVAFGATISAS